MTSLSAKLHQLRDISLRELLGNRLSVPAVVHGPDEVLHEWIVRVHDEVIQVRREVTKVDLVDLDRLIYMSHVMVELAIHVDPGACSMASLTGILT